MSGCIEWQGATANGYGRRRVGGGRRLLVHRIAWEQAHGPIPEGLCVLHRCDNPPCYNVDHLFLGTHIDNMHDMIAKGRARHPGQPGEANAAAKLTDAEVGEIRRLYATGEYSQRVIAQQFNITRSHVSFLANNKRRAEVRVTPIASQGEQT